MKVPPVDLIAQYAPLKDEILSGISDVFENQAFILGAKVEECEKAIAAYSQCENAVGVSSGTDALLACLAAEEIGAGDEVITTPFTFFATAGSISRAGAKPVFVDIDPVTFNIDPALIEEKITEKTRAIMPVHLYGQMADMDAIMAIARKHNLTAIEDAAQAIGSEYKGRRAGSIGDYGCFSFYPPKNLGGAGDGGMVVTNDAARAEKLRAIRVHGENRQYYHRTVGGNFRFDALQAVVISTKLPHLDDWIAKRHANAARYECLFSESGLVEKGLVALPTVVASRHNFNQFVIRVPRRDELRAHLMEKEIIAMIYYPLPLHLQECFVDLGGKEGDCPESERAAKEVLALPVFPELSQEQAEFVVENIAGFLNA